MVPMDVRIPKVRVRTRHAKQLSNQRLVISIDEWDVDSTYPHGHIVRQLGAIGELETEIQGLYSCSIFRLLKLIFHSCISNLGGEWRSISYSPFRAECHCIPAHC